MQLSILIIPSGGLTRAVRCLRAVADTVPESVEFEAVLVANGSPEDVSAALRGFQGLLVVRNDAYAGFRMACGQAVRVARGEILVVMRDDVRPQPGWVEPLIGSLGADPLIDAVRPEVIAADDQLRSGACVALRRASIAAGLACERIPNWELEEERVGRLVLEAEGRAPIEPRSIVVLDADGQAAPGSCSSESEELTAILMDGARPVCERVVAGVLVSAQNPSAGAAATVRGLLAEAGPQERALIGSRLEPHGVCGVWEQLLQDAPRPSSGLFWAGLLPHEHQRSQVVADLQLLNDVLSASPLAGRYWMIAGMLIGWARDRDLIDGADEDFDFAFRGADLDHFRSAMVDLVRAGFMPRHKFPSLFEPLEVLTLVRHGTRFEFYRMDRHDPDTYHSYSYGGRDGLPVKNTHAYARQPLVAVDFLDRLWLKSEDHDAELTDEYGDWRVPDPFWDSMEALNIVAREPWAGPLQMGTPGAYDLLTLALH